MVKIPVHIIGNMDKDRAGVSTPAPSCTLELNLPREEDVVVEKRVEQHGKITVYVEDMTTYEEITEED